MYRYCSAIAAFCLATVLVFAGGPASASAVPKVSPQTMTELQNLSDAFAAVAARVQPGVVTIFSEKVIKVQNSFSGDPFQGFFGGFPFQFQNPPQSEEHEHGLGSGVIISKDGYILTNNHVVSHADKISVELADGRKLKARVVGTDPKTDVAVVKINATDLPALTLGDSDSLRVGQWVLAVGNPFGLQHTVTYGIVSAVGRGNMGLADYEDFIQTDAAINPGNSGGALVNLQGEVVGINTAILTRSGGYQGIGFAIPINMARNIMHQLIAHGRVRRGFLGVTIQEITPEMADALKLKTQEGVLIGGVEPNTPAKKAGLERGDVIVGLNGQPVKTTLDLRNRIAETAPGTTVHLKVLRDGVKKDFSVTLEELPQEQPAAQANASSEKLLGIQVQALTSALASRLGYDHAKGVLISEVDPNGVAYEAGLRQGDLIQEINRQPVRNLRDYNRMMSQMKDGDTVLLLVRRQDQTFFVALRLGG